MNINDNLEGRKVGGTSMFSMYREVYDHHFLTGDVDYYIISKFKLDKKFNVVECNHKDMLLE